MHWLERYSVFRQNPMIQKGSNSSITKDILKKLHVHNHKIVIYILSISLLNSIFRLLSG